MFGVFGSLEYGPCVDCAVTESGGKGLGWLELVVVARGVLQRWAGEIGDGLADWQLDGEPRQDHLFGMPIGRSSGFLAGMREGVS